VKAGGPDTRRPGVRAGQSPRAGHRVAVLVVGFLVGVLAGERFLPSAALDLASLVLGIPILIVVISALAVTSGRAASEGLRDGRRLLSLWRGKGRSWPARI
jgi:hypothetical protein